MEEYLGKDDISINRILENGRIKFRDWRRMTINQRAFILDEINDENYSIEILDEIHPDNRCDVPPDDYRTLQIRWLSENQLQPRTRGMIDSLRTALHAEMKIIREQHIRLVSELVNRIITEQQASNTRNPHTQTYSGHGLDPYY